MAYFIKISDKAFGPLSIEKLSQLISSGKVNRNTEISTDKTSWERLEMYPELMASAFGTQPEISPPLGNPPAIPEQSFGNTNNEQWFFSNDNSNVYGPFPSASIINLINANGIHAQTLIWKEGDNSSCPISKVQEFASFFANCNDVPLNSIPKSRMTYVLLGLFLGGFGVHNFYAGYMARGIIQLLSTIMCIGFLYVPIWVIIEICIVRIDADGNAFQE